MTSTFAPDFNFGPDFNFDFGPNNNEPPSGNQELFTFDPYTRTGVPIFYNWLNAHHCGYDGEIVTKKQGPGTPGVTTGVFSVIPDEDLATERPLIRHGKNDEPGKVDRIHVSGTDTIKYLFRHTYEDQKRFEINWHGYYSNKNWYQYFNVNVVNTTTKVYPFATKGISLRLRVPSGSNETWNSAPSGSGKNYGNHLQINQAFGLWIDLNGKYYIYKMECHGDNKYRAIYGGDPRPKNGDIYQEAWDWNGDRYYFLEDPNHPVGHTSKQMVQNIVPRGGNRGLTMFTNETSVRDKFFVGFSIDIHHDRSAGSKRNHSYLISRVTPIPFYCPRHDPKIKAVLGEPTELEDIRDGYKKIHFWNPPKTYYDWSDDIDYEPGGIDTVPEGDDTLDLETAPPTPPPAEIIEPSSIFVNEKGDGIPIPADFDLDDYLDDLAEEIKNEYD